MESAVGMSGELVVNIKWNGSDYKIKTLTASATVADLKNAIFDQTHVMPARQKLLGLKYNGNFCFMHINVTYA